MRMFPKVDGTYGILAWTRELPGGLVQCALCGQQVGLAEAITGSLYADGRQAFACTEHLGNIRTWLTDWTRFSIAQSNRAMKEWYAERQKVNPQRLSQAIAARIQVRHSSGKTLVVTSQPGTMLSTVRKQWAKILHLLQVERASTLNKALVKGWTDEIVRMNNLKFSTVAKEGECWVDVNFAKPNEIKTLPLDCDAVYVCVPLDECKHLLWQTPEQCVTVLFDFIR